MSDRLNPYDSPANSGDVPARPVVVFAPRTARQYSPIEGRTRLLQFLQVVMILLGLFVALQAANATFFLDEASRDLNRDAELQSTGRRILIASVAGGAVSVAYGITFLFWVHGAYFNIRPLGGHPKLSPAIAVVLCLIPVVNLVTTILVLWEIWDGSDPDEMATDTTSLAEGSPTMILWWWLAVLNDRGVNLYLLFQLPAAQESIAGRMTVSAGLILTSCIAILQLLLAFWMVGCIYKNQDERNYQLIHAVAAATGHRLRAFSQDS